MKKILHHAKSKRNNKLPSENAIEKHKNIFYSHCIEETTLSNKKIKIKYHILKQRLHDKKNTKNNFPNKHVYSKMKPKENLFETNSKHNKKQMFNM